jgi:ribosome-associated translation inhibitor RaiA
MNLQFSFKKMDSSDALMSLAMEKIGSRINGYSSACINPHLTFSKEQDAWKIHFSMLTGDGYRIETSHIGPNIFAELDVIGHRIETQLLRHKEKLVLRKGSRGLSEAAKKWPAPRHAMSWSEGSDFDPIDAGDILKIESTKRGNLWKAQR